MLATAVAVVVLVHREEIYRRGLRRLLEDADLAVVVGDTARARDALDLVATARPDVVVVDEILADGDGLQLVRQLTARPPSPACVLVTEGDPRTDLAAVLLGAGVVHARDEADRLRAAVRSAVDGGHGVDDDLVRAALERAVGQTPLEVAGHPLALTPQERRVFELVGQGLTNRRVAEVMRLTEKTVKNYVSRVLARLGMRHRTELAILVATLSRAGPSSPGRPHQTLPR